MIFLITNVDSLFAQIIGIHSDISIYILLTWILFTLPPSLSFPSLTPMPSVPFPFPSNIFSIFQVLIFSIIHIWGRACHIWLYVSNLSCLTLCPPFPITFQFFFSLFISSGIFFKFSVEKPVAHLIGLLYKSFSFSVRQLSTFILDLYLVILCNIII